MFDGFWESFATAFTISFAVCFGIVLVIRIWQWTGYLIGNRIVEAVEDRNDEMTGERKPQGHRNDFLKHPVRSRQPR